MKTLQVARDQVKRFHDLLFGPVLSAYPADALIEICGPATNFSARGHRVPLRDVEAFVDESEKFNSGLNTFFAVAPVPHDRLNALGRARKEHVLAMPALFVDLDIAVAGHSDSLKLPLPTEDEALAILSEVKRLGIPLIVTCTGGGFHLYCPLTQPLDSRSPRGLAVLAAWKRLWVGLFEAAGRHLDAGVLADPARVLRVPGTWRTKPAAPEPLPVTIVEETSGRVSLDQLEHILPPEPARPQRPTKTTTIKRAVEHDRPGDRLKVTVPVEVLLEQVHGWERVSEMSDGEVRWAAPGGPFSAEVQASTFPCGEAGEFQTVTVWSEAVRDQLGIPADQKSLSSWEWLGVVHCAGDWALAAAIARQFPTPDELVPLLVKHTTDEELRAAIPVAPDTLDEALGLVVSEPQPLSVALEHMSGERAMVDAADNTFVVLGGPKHGLWHRKFVKDGDGGQVPVDELVVPWVAFRDESVVTSSMSPSGVVEHDTTFSVTLVIANGRRHRRAELSDLDSVSPRTLDRLNAGVGLPVSATGKERVANMLRSLGHAEMVVRRQWRQNGWIWVDGHATWVAPAGSVCATGVTHDVVVGPPVGSDRDGLSETLQRIGAPSKLVPLPEAAKACMAFVRLAPGRPEVGLALLGAVFSAPLMLATRASIGLVGEPDSGKSLLLAAAMSWVADVPIAKGGNSMDIKSSSPPGALAALAWAVDGVIFADDFKVSEQDRNATATAIEVVTALVRGSYGGGTGLKATREGGMRSARPARSTLVWTGELVPADESVRGKTVAIQIGREDLHLKDIEAPIDQWRTLFAETGAARSLFARFLMWLAQVADAEGGLDVIAKRAAHIWHKHYRRLEGAREAETVASVATGIDFLRRFLYAFGLIDALPPGDQLQAAVNSLATAQGAALAEATPAARVLAAVGDMVTGRKGHLLSVTGGRPGEGKAETDQSGLPVIELADEALSVACGWRQSVADGPTGETVRWDPCGPALGWISPDRQCIAISRAGLTAAKQFAEMGHLQATQIYRGLKDHVVPGSVPGERPPAVTGLGVIRHAVVVTPEAVGLSFPVPPGNSVEHEGVVGPPRAPETDELVF